MKTTMTFGGRFVFDVRVLEYDAWIRTRVEVFALGETEARRKLAELDYRDVTLAACGPEESLVGPSAQLIVEELCHTFDVAPALLRDAVLNAAHKAAQYDDVVEQLCVPDGGRYRTDTMEKVLLVARQAEEDKKEIERLRGLCIRWNKMAAHFAAGSEFCNDPERVLEALNLRGRMDKQIRDRARERAEILAEACQIFTQALGNEFGYLPAIGAVKTQHALELMKKAVVRPVFHSEGAAEVK